MFYENLLTMIPDILLLLASVMLAVLVPQLVALVLLVIYRLIEQGVQVPVLILLCAFAATCTTGLLYLLDEKIHERIDTYIKPKKTGRFSRMKRYMSERIASLSNSGRFWCGIALGSSSIIPDLLLIEISRERMKKRYFFLAIITGKVLTYSILIGGAVGIFETFKHMLFV